MVKRSKAERVASAGGRVAGRSVGTGIGAALSSPFGFGALAIGGLLIGLFLFRDRISNFLSSVPAQITGSLPDLTINLPAINLPELPQITLPALPEPPDFSSIFESFANFFNQQNNQSGLAGQTVPSEEGGAPVTIPPDTVLNPDGTVSSSTPPTIDLGLGEGFSNIDPLGEIAFNQLRSQVFNTLTQTIGLTSTEAFAALKDVEFKDGFGALDAILQSFNTPFTPPLPPDQNPFGFDETVLNTIGTEQEFTGGGQGFMGGSINPTPITTLSQVLALFPQATASQAANFLAEFSGILPEAALQQGLEVVSLSSSPLDPPQMFNQSSVGTEGISPEELFKLLFPNLISNF